ncbi:hypothetical protein [Motiliproteus sp. MSK22-1]|uniref:hypothetical protein n=1 Tax=Motiliproteus sp. MSK22-1 TaxID=1897630 RepID=UPI000975D6FE|nr:hypothetical protein [Motiliproteus sp. MSK22-1]OMH39111.1 hypothetical protein BGP75_05260 [Motiliproteus sp. MSK22-1]
MSVSSLNALPQSLGNYWRQLAYRNRAAEVCLYVLLASGLPLWSGFDLPWFAARVLLFLHCFSGLILFPVYVVPFWFSHRRLLRNSNKPLLKVTGQLLDLLLLLSTVSGFFLLLVGNRGEFIGWVNHYTHLITALPLGLLLMRHAARWSVLRPLYGLPYRLLCRLFLNR